MRTTFLPFCLGFLLVSAKATAQASFHWKADGSVEIGLASVAAKGSLRDGSVGEYTAGTVTIWAIPFSNAFVALAWADSAKDYGYVVILERQNSRYHQITREIRGRSGTLVTDVQGAVQALQKTSRWDHSLALRKMASYFAENPKATITDFYDAVELGKIQGLAKPDPKGSKPKQQTRPRKGEAPRENPYDFAKQITIAPPPVQKAVQPAQVKRPQAPAAQPGQPPVPPPPPAPVRQQAQPAPAAQPPAPPPPATAARQESQTPVESPARPAEPKAKPASPRATPPNTGLGFADDGDLEAPQAAPPPPRRRVREPLNIMPDNIPRPPGDIPQQQPRPRRRAQPASNYEPKPYEPRFPGYRP
jgi:hypothetical protein